MDLVTGNHIGAGEDATFEILKKSTGLKELHPKDFPNVGIYRQVPISKIYDHSQMQFLADYHRKSSIDIFLVPFYDEYTPQLTRIAVRVEGKKGNMKMIRQRVQKLNLEKWCRVVDVHLRESKELFKDRINPKSIQELKNAFKTAKVEFPGVIQ